MSQGYAVQVRGLDAMRRALRLLQPEFAKALRTANLEVAQRIVAPIAAQQAPKRTGALARDVRGLATQNRARVAVGRSALPYAAPIHWGWPARNIARNTFLNRAADIGRPLVEDAYERTVSRSLHAVGFA